MNLRLMFDQLTDDEKLQFRDWQNEYLNQQLSAQKRRKRLAGVLQRIELECEDEDDNRM